MVSKMDETLAQRGGRYGDFRLNAEISQKLKDVVRESPVWPTMAPYMREGIDLIFLKISRMLSGDWTYDDNPHDMVGYAKLMEDRLKQDNDAGTLQRPRVVDLNYLDIQGIFDYLVGAGVGPLAFGDFCRENKIVFEDGTPEHNLEEGAAHEPSDAERRAAAWREDDGA